MRRLIVFLLIINLLILSSQAQSGRGVIRHGLVSNLDTDITSFNPLLCADTACGYTLDLLFPTLLSIDHDTGWYQAADSKSNALAVNWEISADNLVYTFQLRDDALWSDGTPITAYDYFYTYLAAEQGLTRSRFYSSSHRIREAIAGVVPLSTTELAVILQDPVCDNLKNLDFRIIPNHAFDEDFTTDAQAFFAENQGTVQEMWAAWDDAFNYDFSFMFNHPFNEMPLVTGGSFEFVDWDHRDHIRLQSDDLAYEIVSVSSTNEAIDRFFTGDLHVIDLIPREQLGDFTSNLDVTVHDWALSSWDYIAFNLADPDEPMSAFDEDGNPLEQGEHPILSNLDVRRAIQLGIDVQSVIDIALRGQATVIPANQIPMSWAYDDSLAPFAYDWREAEALLDAAGWVKVGNSSIRQCVNCGTAHEGTRLHVSLGYSTRPHHPVAATIIQQQLRRIGIDVSVYATDLNAVSNQIFDLFLGRWFDSYPTSPGMHLIFTPEADVQHQGWNIGSYNNPEVTALIEAARTVSGCNLAERQALYAQAQAIIQQDLPYVWLYSETRSMAVQAGIQNVQTQANNPLWNLQDWSVFNVD